MKKSDIEYVLSLILEELASVEHSRWAHWQSYLHSKSERQRDGSLLIPAHLVAQWERQIAMPYADLTEAEKESDREQVRSYFPILMKALSEN